MEHTDRRFNQTTDRYAADDLETIREAKRYSAHVFDLFRPHVEQHLRLADDGDVYVVDEKGQRRYGVTPDTIAAELRAEYDGKYPKRFLDRKSVV